MKLKKSKSLKESISDADFDRVISRLDPRMKPYEDPAPGVSHPVEVWDFPNGKPGMEYYMDLDDRFGEDGLISFYLSGDLDNYYDNKEDFFVNINYFVYGEHIGEETNIDAGRTMRFTLSELGKAVAVLNKALRSIKPTTTVDEFKKIAAGLGLEVYDYSI